MLWQDEQQSIDYAAQNSAPDMPATFGEGFDAAWNEGRLFAQSISGENARLDALNDYLADIKDKTGNDIAAGLQYGDSTGTQFPASVLLDQANAKLAKIEESYPDLGIKPMSADDLEQAAVAKSRAAQTRYAAFAGREQTFGSRLGSFLGGAAATAADPVNIVAFPLAPETESVGVLAAALKWGAVAGVSQAAIEATGAPFHEEVQPGYAASGEPVFNVLEAAGYGGALGGVTRALGNAWTRVKTGAWPQSVRDAGNIVESEANVAASNPFPPSLDGAVAHPEAVEKSIDDIAAGRPIDVSQSITPELEQQGERMPEKLGDGAETAGIGMETAGNEVETAGSLPSAAEPLPDVSELQTPMRAALDRARMNGDLEVHLGADAEGNPITQSLDGLLKAIDEDRAAAEHIEGCLNPAGAAP